MGCASGAAVAAIGALAAAGQHLIYALAPADRLSAAAALPATVLLAAPAAGGLILGLMLGASAPGQPIDPIEANALHGGRIPARDGMAIVAQNVVSNGCGASVGLEAGYAQEGGTIAALFGQVFELRRPDRRLLVGCGAGGAIAAAFSAPLTGAFYAFELVIGTYSIAGLVPMIAATVAADLTVRALDGPPLTLLAGVPGVPSAVFYPLSVLLGGVAGLLSTAVMQGVAASETLFKRLGLPDPLRLALGGATVGLVAIVLTPGALGAGHGVLDLVLHLDLPIGALIVLLVAKAVAASVSIGAGFRSGLFFASLLLGAIVGRCGSIIAVAIGLPGEATDAALWTLAGMAAFATGVVGAPLAMTFLVVETTGGFAPALAVLPAVAAASLTVRRLFGYSFATWRFHLRGEAIRSARDLTWVNDLKVGRMMRRDVATAPTGMSVEAFRQAFPLGSSTRVVATDAAGRYAGLVVVSEAHARAFDGATTLGPLLRLSQTTLSADLDARAAMAVFDRTAAEALAVVDGDDGRRILGLLTEAHLLRRYGQELERQRRSETGLS